MPDLKSPDKGWAGGSLGNAARGFCMGAADVVPGVSGGTMAFILGIYPRLIAAIRAFDLELLRLLGARRLGAALRHVDLALLAPLLFGIFTALMVFTRVIPLPRILITTPEPIYSLFFGLILASVWVLWRSLEERSRSDPVWLTVGLAIGFGVVNLVPFDTPRDTWFVFTSGALAICAMILPGISGSFILLILRKYSFVLEAVGRLDLSVLAPFGLGAICGLLLFSRLLNWLLTRHYRATLLTIMGALCGSLWMIWPFQERLYAVMAGQRRLLHSAPVLPPRLDAGLLVDVALVAVGIASVWALDSLARRAAANR